MSVYLIVTLITLVGFATIEGLKRARLKKQDKEFRERIKQSSMDWWG